VGDDRRMSLPVRDRAHELAHSGWLPGSSSYRAVVAVLGLSGMANFALLYYVQPSLPLVAERYQVGAGAAAQVLSVSTIAMAATLLVVGPLSDAFGRVRLMCASLMLSGLLGVASAFAGGWTALLLLRALEGAALAVLPAVALAYLREEIDSSAHLRANGLYIAGTALGGTVARLLPAALPGALGWTGLTLIFSGATLGAAVAVATLLPPSRNFTPTGLDLPRLLTDSRRVLADRALLAWFVVGTAAALLVGHGIRLAKAREPFVREGSVARGGADQRRPVGAV